MQKARSARPARGSRRPSRRRNRRAQELLMQRLEDCHTVTGIRRDSGKVDDAATVQTYRHYLLDARFGVLLEGPSLLLEKVAAALRNPKWGVWLGRKCCLPASPLLVAPPGSRAVVWAALLQRAGYTGTEIEDQFDRVRSHAARLSAIGTMRRAAVLALCAVTSMNRLVGFTFDQSSRTISAVRRPANAPMARKGTISGFATASSRRISAGVKMPISLPLPLANSTPASASYSRA